ncbi:MAG: SH3 domain-containing protein [Proteobacteria bacterium]|nr:SH3 domain-containing protein [Pseudomonadota bacterium]
MKKPVSILLVLSLCMLSTATLAAARSRNDGHGNYYSGYQHSYSYRPYHHSYHAGSYLPLVGVGLLAGAVVGSMIYEPPRHQTIIYSTPPPLIVQSEPMDSDVPEPELVIKQVKITERIVNVRSGPGLDSAIIGQAVAGQTVDVIGAAPEWLYVRTGTGVYGWVMSQYTVESGGPVG